MPSFDVVSKVSWAEIDNALNQASKELGQRFDFQGTGAKVAKTDDGLLLTASTDDRVRAAWKVVEDKLVKRKVSLKHVEPGDVAPGPTASAKMLVKVKEGIEVDKAREIVKHLKESKLKVQGAILEQQVRVTGKNKDDLQGAIRLLRAADFGLELQIMNFRD
ncbi:MAG: YajQ family cyclic di-GMP-binding protein [Polyangiales bacterium]